MSNENTAEANAEAKPALTRVERLIKALQALVTQRRRVRSAKQGVRNAIKRDVRTERLNAAAAALEAKAEALEAEAAKTEDAKAAKALEAEAAKATAKATAKRRLVESFGAMNPELRELDLASAKSALDALIAEVETLIRQIGGYKRRDRHTVADLRRKAGV